MLNERSVSSLRAFLAAHPEVEAVCRDRDPRYAEAIRWEAPTATVVLDRWHLIRNLVDAFERFVAQHHRAWLKTLRDHHAAATAETAGDAAATMTAAGSTRPSPRRARSNASAAA